MELKCWTSHSFFLFIYFFVLPFSDINFMFTFLSLSIRSLIHSSRQHFSRFPFSLSPACLYFLSVFVVWLIGMNLICRCWFIEHFFSSFFLLKMKVFCLVLQHLPIHNELMTTTIISNIFSISSSFCFGNTQNEWK